MKFFNKLISGDSGQGSQGESSKNAKDEDDFFLKQIGCDNDDTLEEADEDRFSPFDDRNDPYADDLLKYSSQERKENKNTSIQDGSNSNSSDEDDEFNDPTNKDQVSIEDLFEQYCGNVETTHNDENTAVEKVGFTE